MHLDINLKVIVKVLLCLFVICYMACPPHNKIAQWKYFFNNLDCFNNKESMASKHNEYLFHRNNAVYLAKMNNKQESLKEIDYALRTAPNNLSKAEIEHLYQDRSKIRLYFDDYKGALNDLLRVKNPNLNDCLKIAMLLKEQGNLKLAASYCNKIMNMDVKAYSGYACFADIYAVTGQYKRSVAIYNLLLDRSTNKAKYYADRAMYKKAAGDIKGYEADLKKAKELYPLLDIKSSITYDAIHKKHLDL